MSKKDIDLEEYVDEVHDESSDDMEPDSLGDMMTEGMSQISWFIIIIIVLSYIFVSSDIFVDNVLNRFPNAVEMKVPTLSGSIIQALSQLLIIGVAYLAKKYIF